MSTMETAGESQLSKDHSSEEAENTPHNGADDKAADRAAMMSEPAAKKALWRRLMPVAGLIALFAGFFALGLDDYLTFEALREHRFALQEFVQSNLILAVAIYMVAYAVSVGVSLPGASFLTIAGGFLFGSVFGTFITVIAATIGATAIFLIARSAFGDMLRDKAKGKIDRLVQGFSEDAFNYMLVLRLVPLFPFFVVNVAPAFADVKLRTYTLATFIGIVPGTFVYSQVGAGLGSVFDSGQEFTAANILTTEIVIALVGLAVLSLIPVVYKKLRGRKSV